MPPASSGPASPSPASLAAAGRSAAGRSPAGPGPAGRSPGGLVHPWSSTEAPRFSVQIVHPGALSVDVYKTLAKALPEAEIHALDLGALPEFAQAALTGGEPPMRLEELAAWCLQALGDHPLAANPVVLVGWSFGGVVAHAMAAQLPADRLPRAVVLLDSIAPVPSFRYQEADFDVAVVLDWFAMYLGAKRHVPLTVGTATFAGLGLKAGLIAVLADGIATGALLPGTTYAGLRKVYDTYADGLRRNSLFVDVYRAAAARTPLVLLRARHGLLPGGDDLGWGELAGPGPRGGLIVETCPDDHYTMLTAPESVAAIARAIRAAAGLPAGQPAPANGPPPVPPVLTTSSVGEVL
jgi:pimeloyl-ACP methyl ester carboxylesterase